MWRIYYEDGTVWDHKQGLDGMPTFGVICILQYINTEKETHRYHIVYGSKFYMRFNDEWLHAYDNDLIDYLVHDKSIKKVLVGRMTTKKRFSEVYEVAKHEKDKEIFT
jgi:hypothetical protein